MSIWEKQLHLSSSIGCHCRLIPGRDEAIGAPSTTDTFYDQLFDVVSVKENILQK